MTIEGMHYDFKMKLNKVDTQSKRNFQIPEIDWIMNQAQIIFVEDIARPRSNKSSLGFETSRRTIEDIRSIVVPDTEVTVTNNLAVLPTNFWFFVNGRATMTKGECTNSNGIVYERQHKDLFEESEFDKTSFDWRVVNAVFNSTGIKLFAKDFTINKLSITYIKKLSYIHNAQKFVGGQYKMPDGVTTLTGKRDCELPEYTHQDIVDIAVMLASGQINASDYDIKRDKVYNVNQFN
jgi:hypothetical protein